MSIEIGTPTAEPSLKSRSRRDIRTLAPSVWLLLGVALVGGAWYIVVGLLIEPKILALYQGNPDVYFALTHYDDARQYVMICSQGYTEDPTLLLFNLNNQRIDWMPLYAVAQCTLHSFGVSLVFTGWVVSILAAAVSSVLATLTLHNLKIRYAGLFSLSILVPTIGGVWLYLAGAEMTFVAVGLAVVWLITLPTATTAWGDVGRAVGGIAFGTAFMLTKPNALAIFPPLVFAFVYLSWRRSQQAGYALGFGIFISDLLIAQIQPALRRVGGWFRVRVLLEDRPVEYEWSALCVAAGIGLGLAYWLWFTSNLSGQPFFFMQQHTSLYLTAVWSGGNIVQMGQYFLQAVHLVSIGPTSWRITAAWNLGANLSALIPAASRRVPTLIRGMLVLIPIFLVFSGAGSNADRYLASTALVAVGWACWLAPTGSGRWSLARVGFVLALFVCTSLLMLDLMLPNHLPVLGGIIDR